MGIWGVDIFHKNNEMLVILKNVMNDLYARDTSSKIWAVKQSTFKSGKDVGCYAPIGYRKTPADKHILEIDPMTAPIVRRIFDMRLQGDSFREIARTLNEEGVPSPRGFYYMAEGRPNLWGETPYWNDVTVKIILRNEVYLGHMVRNKTGSFIAKAKRYTNITELTPELLRLLIQKILVHEKSTKWSKKAMQTIEIRCSDIGFIGGDIPQDGESPRQEIST